MKLSISITQSLPTPSDTTPRAVTTQSLPSRVDAIQADALPADTPHTATEQSAAMLPPTAAEQSADTLPADTTPTATEQSAAMLPPTATEQSVDALSNTAQLYGYVRVSTREQNEARQIMPATVLPENATDRSVVWSSSNTSVATVEDSIVYAIAPGTAVIKATAASDSSKYATCKVTVKAVVSEKKLTKTGSNGTVSLEKGEQLQLIPTFATKKGWTVKSYASSNKKIATVNASGLVTANKAGTATITVKTKNGKKATIKIKVVDPTVPTKVELNKAGTVKLKKGKTLRLTATVYSDTAVTTLTWKSSNKKVATVNKNGVVKGVKKGTATITVKTKNGKTATVKIKVVS